MKKGYKGFDKDFKCRGFQYEVGKTYECGKAKVCNCGFHYCKNIKDILIYYPITSRFAEIEDLGKTETKDNKSATNKIKIVKELTREELLILFECKDTNLGNNNLGDNNLGDNNLGNNNSGNKNLGYNNLGDNNLGNNNSGNKNLGDNNSGNKNLGDWNKCDFETGFFNSKQNKHCNVFNKKCLRSVWISATKPNFIYNVILNTWINWNRMTDEEKKSNPNAYTQDGYLKNISMEDAWIKAFENVTDEDIKLLKALPNYNYKVFNEISGIEDERLK
ncbi:MAG: hypothetical protein RSD40_03435 [Bacilli bacterium]